MEMREFTKNDWMAFAGAESAEERKVTVTKRDPQICVFGGACEGKDGNRCVREQDGDGPGGGGEGR